MHGHAASTRLFSFFIDFLNWYIFVSVALQAYDISTWKCRSLTPLSTFYDDSVP
jgi:hypothetical protein